MQKKTVYYTSLSRRKPLMILPYVHSISTNSKQKYDIELNFYSTSIYFRTSSYKVVLALKIYVFQCLSITQCRVFRHLHTV